MLAFDLVLLLGRHGPGRWSTGLGRHALPADFADSRRAL